MACIQALQLPTTLPFGITLGLPTIGIGIDLGINFCCHFNLPLQISTADLLALLRAAGLDIHSISLSANLLKPVQAQLLAVNNFLKKLTFSCPMN